MKVLKRFRSRHAAALPLAWLCLTGLRLHAGEMITFASEEMSDYDLSAGFSMDDDSFFGFGTVLTTPLQQITATFTVSRVDTGTKLTSLIVKYSATNTVATATQIATCSINYTVVVGANTVNCAVPFSLPLVNGVRAATAYYVAFAGPPGTILHLNGSQASLHFSDVNPCTFTINPPSNTVASTGTTTGTFQLTASPTTCNWTVMVDRNYAVALPATGSGNATISYTVYPNFSSASRPVNINVGTQKFGITQLGASGTQDERFVSLLYYNFLGRLPSQSELNFQVNSGQTRQALTMNFLNAAEFNAGGKLIAGVYFGVLGRDAEYTGWLFQRDNLVRGVINQASMVTNFLGSAEFIAKYGTLTDSALVILLYQQILGRTPNQSEINFQVSAIQTRGRGQFGADLLSSPEFQTRASARLLAFLLYSCLLERDPSASDLNTRTTQIQTGSRPLATLVSDFLGSAEFAILIN